MFKARRLLAWLFLLIGVANLIRGVLAFSLVPVFAERELALPLPLLGGVYLLAGGAFLVVALLIFLDRAWRTALPLVLVYESGMWAIALVGYRGSYIRGLWARDLLFTILLLGATAYLVWRGGRGRSETSDI